MGALQQSGGGRRGICRRVPACVFAGHRPSRRRLELFFVPGVEPGNQSGVLCRLTPRFRERTRVFLWKTPFDRAGAGMRDFGQVLLVVCAMGATAALAQTPQRGAAPAPSPQAIENAAKILADVRKALGGE